MIYNIWYTKKIAMRIDNGLTHNLPHHKLDRVTLKDQVTIWLRDAIIAGRVAPGTKIVERDVAEMLGVSRAPARDALMQLEKEGLVISRPDARYVIELNDRDIYELHQVRLALEAMAVDLATINTSPENQQAQLAVLQQMEKATENQDRSAFAKADLDGHALIWEQACNIHLEKALRAMLGPIFMFMANATEHYDWQETLDLHRELVRCINAGDRDGAANSIRRHMENSRDRALGILQARANQD